MKTIKKILVSMLILVLAFPLLGFTKPTVVAEAIDIEISQEGLDEFSLQESRFACPDETILRYVQRYTRHQYMGENFEVGRIQVIVNHYKSVNSRREDVERYLQITLGAVSVDGWIYMEEVEENPLWNRANFQQILDVRIGGGYAASRIEENIEEISMVRSTEDRTEVFNAVSAFDRSEKILVAMPVYHNKSLAAFVPNDTQYVAHQQQMFRRIGMENAWAITRGNPNIRVGVMDDGRIFDHEDFRDANNVSRVLQGNHPAGVGGHATQVAGVIGAITDNNRGIAGVAQVSMLPHGLPRLYQRFFCLFR